MKKILVLLCLAALLFAGIAAQDAPVAPADAAHSKPGTTYYLSLTVYQLLHKPTISAAFIHLLLVAAHSAAAGESQALYDLGAQSGVDPVYALAFFHHESIYGTTGEA